MLVQRDIRYISYVFNVPDLGYRVHTVVLGLKFCPFVLGPRPNYSSTGTNIEVKTTFSLLGTLQEI